MARRISELNVGDKVRFGAYSIGNEGTHKIAWIKVNGDNTFMSERIEDFRAFDAREPESPDTNRRRYGNNRYSVSNIDQFLNSSDDECLIKRHEYDEPPTRDLVSGNTEYAHHHGFLRFFEGWEVDAIDDSVVMTALPDCEVALEDERLDIITRKVFLPSYTNLYGKTIRNVSEGDYWEYFKNGINTDRTAIPTDYAVEYSNVDAGVEDDENWYYLLRSPSADNGYCVRYVNRDGDFDYCCAVSGILGVRPALKINPEILISDKPDDMGYYDVIQTEIVYEDVSEEELFSILTI